ncbi:MAG: AMP-dependent synthetase and ligase [Halothiobacillaceae bacterium]|nr:MAG: AMP-dependent synthetase and ligase [Halothiobacillaceae bacterium]
MTTLLHAIEQHAQKSPASVAVIGQNLQLSYRALQQEITKLAALFAVSGFQRVALFLDNSPVWVVADLAAQRAGVALTPLPTFFTAKQIEHALADASVQVILTDNTHIFGKELPQYQARPFITVLGLGLWSVIRDAKKVSNVPRAVAKITYTSGTTGEAKGVCLSQSLMDRVAKSLVEAVEVTPRDRHLCLLPLPVLLENIAGIYTCLLAGACCMVPSLSAAYVGAYHGRDVAADVACAGGTGRSWSGAANQFAFYRCRWCAGIARTIRTCPPFRTTCV